MRILTKPASTFPEIPIPSRLCLFPATRGSSSAIHPLLRLHEQKRSPFLIYKKRYYMVRKKTSCLPSTSKKPDWAAQFPIANCQFSRPSHNPQDPHPPCCPAASCTMHNALQNRILTASTTLRPSGPPPQVLAATMVSQAQPGHTAFRPMQMRFGRLCDVTLTARGLWLQPIPPLPLPSFSTPLEPGTPICTATGIRLVICLRTV